ncbi:MAG TPA: prenyltransferase/squalene oxidase repeat-containing protein [Pirellulaceae bacterium]|nr:prenyltransferase/squalene oxidase repeat-containing protein [Pirellulaceae bacterium]HMO90739.1 prenyltransferase/squalene oxidase repeat-containing protein [Pirellulaceae bacterium]HMP67990.1 prenyltransferase/squalene oxidase repeat-containing protein [Pirellulaceae bacterium]
MRFNRRQFLLRTTAGAACAAGSANPLLADRKRSANEKSPAELFTPEVRAAVERGLAYLARKQITNGANRGAFGNSSYAAGVAVCGLGGLAFMCGGHAPSEGLYGQHVERCIEFVLRNTRDTGYITRGDNTVHENMYGHGFAMLFLAQAYGMTMKAEIEEKLRRAVALTCKSQNGIGGWRYQPSSSDADLSITVCQIMALRAAHDAGITVSDTVRSKCIDYVKKSQNLQDGSFRYTINGHSTTAMTAAGVTSLYSAGIYEGEQVEKALKYLSARKPPSGSSDHYYFYTQYYAVQAMWHAGGEYWNEWYPAIRMELLQKQSADGSWSIGVGGPELGTAMASIILQMPLNFLPVFSP